MQFSGNSVQKRVNSVLRHFVLICHYEEDHVGELKIGREGGGRGQLSIGLCLVTTPCHELIFYGSVNFVTNKLN